MAADLWDAVGRGTARSGTNAERWWTIFSRYNSRMLGRHFLIDYADCHAADLPLRDLEIAMLRAAELCGATVVTSEFHRFNPHGLSGVVVIAESHLAVHTWPEHRSVCVDLFTCSEAMDAEAAIEHLQQIFGATSVHRRTIDRGRQIDAVSVASETSSHATHLPQ